jgi:hypothetical protein
MPSWCRALDAHRRAPGSSMAGEPPRATRIAPSLCERQSCTQLGRHCRTRAHGRVKENATLGWAGVSFRSTSCSDRIEIGGSREKCESRSIADRSKYHKSLLHGLRPHSPQPNILARGRCNSLKRRIGVLLDPTDGETQPDRLCTGQARRTAPAPTVSLHGSRSAVVRTLLN